ncbi:MAG: DNA-3-methyladenine glycosylase [Oscillospiraceae bacterium]|jgi:DNA-3-methyladenine glycosylase|nr:DNA-3-methyladenine glycosylase [Oscillospiraceae bacterium]
MKLNAEFYRQNAIILAPEILGKLLCRNLNGEIIKLRITETESYFGEQDTACHAHKGKTERTKIMYENGGLAYVYLCYGIHYMLNIVVGVKNSPEAVLVRGAEGFNGPGKLTKALKIDKNLNGENFATSNQIWLEDDGHKYDFKTAKRVGIAYASEEDKNKLWRFVLNNYSKNLLK